MNEKFNYVVLYESSLVRRRWEYLVGENDNGQKQEEKKQL